MARLGQWWRDLGRHDKVLVVGLGALLAAGTALRVAIMAAAPPAFLGYPDSYYYIEAAAQSLFSDPFHPAGYPAFLRVLHALDPHLVTVAAAQHLLGLATGVLLVLTLRRAGVRGLWSLLPAAAVFLSGPMVWLEQAPLGETLFVALQAGALFAVVRALDARTPAWAVAAGAFAALGVLVRPVGLFSLVVAVAWLLVMTPGPLRRRVLPAAAAGLAALVVLGGYSAVQRQLTGDGGLVRASGWLLYARAAPFADCERFDPPKGTARLCETTDPSTRPGPNDYVFGGASPAIRAYGFPHDASSRAFDDVGRFARTAMLHQPLDWLGQVVREELPRFVSSGRYVRDDQGMDFELFADTLAAPVTPDMSRQVTAFYADEPAAGDRPSVGAMRSYESWTRIDGILSVVLMALALAGVVLARGRQRAVAILLVLVAFGTMLVSALTLFYDVRYAIAALGPLAAAAGIGAAAVAERVRARRQAAVR